MSYLQRVILMNPLCVWMLHAVMLVEVVVSIYLAKYNPNYTFKESDFTWGNHEFEQVRHMSHLYRHSYSR